MPPAATFIRCSPGSRGAHRLKLRAEKVKIVFESFKLPSCFAQLHFQIVCAQTNVNVLTADRLESVFVGVQSRERERRIIRPRRIIVLRG
jgi:hypothetical protein